MNRRSLFEYRVRVGHTDCPRPAFAFRREVVRWAPLAGCATAMLFLSGSMPGLAADAPAAPATTTTAAALAAPAPAKAAKGAPLPLHTIEGVGGVVITPIAYPVNPGAPGTLWGQPSVSATYVNARQKNIETLAVTETVGGRVELGYAASRFGLGTLGSTVAAKTGLEIGRSDVYLHNFNARGLVIKEGSYGPFTPAVTVGIQAKYNDGISEISNNLKSGGVMRSIGFHNNFGIDYVLTATKLIPKVANRPLIVTGGFRLSEADQIGYAGFGDAYVGTFEGNLVYLVTNNVAAAAEYRQKREAYVGLPGIWNKEDNWWTLGVGYVANSHLTGTVGYGNFGHVLDTVENAGWALSAKYEF